MVTASFQENKYGGKLVKQPSKLDVQPWIQPGPGETIINQKFLAEIFLGVGGDPPPKWNISIFNPPVLTPPTPPLKGGGM